MSTARDNPRGVIRASLKGSLRTSGGGGGGADVVTSADVLFHLEAANYANDATWPDSGPNGYTFTKTGSPTQTAEWTNGLPAVDFPGGGNDFFTATGVLAVGTPASGHGFSFFYVGEFDAVSVAAMHLAPATSPAASNSFHWNNGFGNHGFFQSGPDCQFSTAAQIGLGEYFVVGGTFPEVRTGAEDTYTRAMGSNETIDDSADRTGDHAGPLTTWHIGSDKTAAVDMDGRIAEVVVYQDEIPQAEMEAKVAQLAAKYAILGA